MTSPAPFAAGPVTVTDADAVAAVAQARPAGASEGAGDVASQVGSGVARPVTPSAPGLPTGRAALLWYGGGSAVVLVVGFTVVLALLLTGQLGSGRGPLAGRAAPPEDLRPPLARLCAAPTGPAAPGPAGPSPGNPSAAGTAPAGPRTIDPVAGISYRAYGAPWLPWSRAWTMGTLGVPYREGQYFVTERFGGGEYLATIISGAVPATVNDSTAFDIECTGRQVAADVRASYYPQPNTMDVLRAGRTTLGGAPAWVTEFRLRFSARGLAARDELVGVALLDVGRPTAAVLYVSIPGTHPQYDYVVNDVLESAQPS